MLRRGWRRCAAVRGLTGGRFCQVVIALGEGCDEVLWLFCRVALKARPCLGDVDAKWSDEVCHLCEGSPGVAPEPGNHSFQVNCSSRSCVVVLASMVCGDRPLVPCWVGDPCASGQGHLRVEVEW